MLKVLYNANDARLANRIESDLRNAGYDLLPADQGMARDDVLIPILSPAAQREDTILDAIYAALDRSQHVLPVIAQPVDIPRTFNHLPVVDFSETYDFNALKASVDAALSSNARLPLKVLTPATRRANRTTGLVVALIAVFMFLVGLYAVGVLKIQMPQEEYNAVDTEAAMTRDAITAPELEIYARFLPQSTEDAANYQATLQAVPTAYRPLMAMTATAHAQGTVIAPTPSPAGE